MFENNSFQPYSLTTSTPPRRYDVGVAAVSQAVTQFQNLCLRARIKRLVALAFGQPRSLLNLASVKAQGTLERSHLLGVQTVAIRQIRGSECRSQDFDTDFNPLQTRSRDRWVSIAAARSVGTPMPAVELIQVGDVYFVRDGHHRVSVARWMGEEYIDAHVTVWVLRMQPETAAVRVLQPQPAV